MDRLAVKDQSEKQRRISNGPRELGNRPAAPLIILRSINVSFFIYLFIFLFIFKIIHRHNNLGLTSTWGRRLPFASLSPISLVPRSMVQGARGFGGTIRENFFYLLLMNDMHDAIFFFLVYFVGVTARIVAGAGELDSFSRLCSFNPLLAFRASARGCYRRFAGFPIQICYRTSLDTGDTA